MPSWVVFTEEFDLDPTPLITRRLREREADFTIADRKRETVVTLRGSRAAGLLAQALARVLCRDLSYFVMARMADRLPLNLEEKQTVLTEALSAARGHEEYEKLAQGIAEELKRSTSFCLEGYLTFRMQEYTELWQLYVEQAAAQALLGREYQDLLQALDSYLEALPPRVCELQLCIHADGRCTLTDDCFVRLEYEDGAREGLVNLLIHMAPKTLIIYDLSGQKENRLTETLAQLFSGRVKIYR